MRSINPGVVTYYGNFVPVCSFIPRIRAWEQALWGALAAGQEKEESMQLHRWNLNSTSNSPVASRPSTEFSVNGRKKD